MACDGPTAPLPASAREFVPPPAYARWWAATAACAGLPSAAARVRWYAAPGDSVRLPDGAWAGGYYEADTERIVLADAHRLAGGLVRHEMLHALLGRSAGGHPPAYFQGRCGGWVDCAEAGCADEGAAFPAPPAGAAVLAGSELELTGEVAPAAVARAPDDAGAFVVVRVRNPRAEAVWVELAAPPDCGPRCPEYAWFGYGIAYPGSAAGGVSQGELRTTRRRRFALPPGGTRLEAFDVELAGYPAGAYVARVFFNPADWPGAGPGSATVPFRIER